MSYTREICKGQTIVSSHIILLIQQKQYISETTEIVACNVINNLVVRSILKKPLPIMLMRLAVDLSMLIYLFGDNSSIFIDSTGLLVYSFLLSQLTTKKKQQWCFAFFGTNNNWKTLKQYLEPVKENVIGYRENIAQDNFPLFIHMAVFQMHSCSGYFKPCPLKMSERLEKTVFRIFPSIIFIAVMSSSCCDIFILIHGYFSI